MVWEFCKITQQKKKSGKGSVPIIQLRIHLKTDIVSVNLLVMKEDTIAADGNSSWLNNRNKLVVA